MKSSKLESLLLAPPGAEAFVRESLGALEAEHKRVALLALADWVRLGRAAPALFPAIATLQRPSWGSWNGLILGLREARRDALRDASAQEREEIDAAHVLRRLLSALEQPLDADQRERLVPGTKALGLRLPKSLRWRELLALPIALRNRVAHDAPTDPAWWSDAAQELRPLLELHVHASPVEPSIGEARLEEPWSLRDGETQWTFAGITPQFEARYVDPGGNQRLDTERGVELLTIFQRLLGKEAVQAKHFRRLLGRLAPEDIKGVLMGDLLVGKPVGRGGFATVHVGRQLSTGRKVAVKILHDGMEEDAKERFRREAAYLSRFRDPHIVQVLSYGEERWSAPKQISLMDEDWFKVFKKTAPIKTYMALEWIDGETLEDVYQRPRDTEDTQKIAAWMAEAAGALASVHGAHLIHRDIKPANLMVTEDRGVVLMDFGIARSQDEGRTLLTATGTAVGTPAYMSPEQLRAVDADAEVGPPSDVYSLCATFFELFAGERLYHHDTESPETVRTQKSEGQRPELPKARGQRLPWEVRTILFGGLEADPRDRYASATDLQADLLRFLGNEPIAYRRPSLLRRTQLAYRRNRTVVNLVGGFVLVAIGLVAWLQWSAADKRREELRQREAVVLTAAATAREKLTPLRVVVADLDGPDARPLRSASGEPIPAAVDAWFDAHVAAVERLEALLRLATRAPTERARREIDPETVRAEHAALCRKAAQQATQLAQFTLANMWIARAAGEGSLNDTARAAEVQAITAARKRRIEEDLERARAILASTRQEASITPEFVEQQVIAVVRLASPDLVRLLLDPRYLDSPDETERRIVIGALGRLGDNRTKGPQGLDAVDTLALRLEDVDPKRDLPLALAIASALGDLRDARGHAVFERKRRQAGPSSPFTERSQHAFARIPLPTAPPGAETENLDALRERAELLADKERWQEVAAIYDRIVAKSPDSASAYRERARARGMLDDAKGALADYDRALELWPGWADALGGRALVLVSLQRLEDARRDALRAIEARPGEWLAYMALGSVEAAVGRWDEAEQAFTRVIEIDAQLSQAYMQRGLARLQLGKRREAQADFAQLKELNPDAPEVLMISAEAYVEAGQYELALADADRAVALDPTRPELFAIRALCWAVLGGAPNKVEADIRTVLRLAPDQVNTKLLVCQAWMGIQRHAEALDAVNSILAVDAANAQALLLRGRIHEDGGDDERALADYADSIHQNPRHVDAYLRRARLLARTGRVQQALQDIDRAQELAPRSLLVKLERGKVYAKQARWTDALREFTEVLRVDPVHRVALRERGIARRGVHDYKGSIADLSLVLEGRPDDVALLQRAVTYLRMREYAYAEQDLDRVIELDPKEPSAFLNRSIARKNLGRLKDAWEDAQQAIRLRPTEAPYRIQAGDVAKARGRTREAIDAYGEAIRLDPRSVDAYNHRGSFLLQQGNLTAALRDHEKALEFDANSLEARLGRGTVFLQAGKTREAIDDFNLALDAKPSPLHRAALLTNRARAQQAMGEPDAAMKDYDAALRASPGFPTAYFARGMLHAELGDDEKAHVDLSTFLKLVPDGPDAERVRRYLASVGDDK